jgi:hypothetical protein
MHSLADTIAAITDRHTDITLLDAGGSLTVTTLGRALAATQRHRQKRKRDSLLVKATEQLGNTSKEMFTRVATKYTDNFIPILESPT